MSTPATTKTLTGIEMMNTLKKSFRALALAFVLSATMFAGSAQEAAAQRNVRAYIPPDQLVSFFKKETLLI